MCAVAYGFDAIQKYGNVIRACSVLENGRPFMAKKKKPSLSKVLKEFDSLSDDVFGEVNVDLSTLPCLKKIPREKITANIDSDVLTAMKSIAKKNKISYSALMNDVLRKVFIEKDQEAG